MLPRQLLLLAPRNQGINRVGLKQCIIALSVYGARSTERRVQVYIAFHSRLLLLLLLLLLMLLLLLLPLLLLLLLLMPRLPLLPLLLLLLLQYRGKREC